LAEYCSRSACSALSCSNAFQTATSRTYRALSTAAFSSNGRRSWELRPFHLPAMFCARPAKPIPCVLRWLRAASVCRRSASSAEDGEEGPPPPGPPPPPPLISATRRARSSLKKML